ncbi:MAG: Lytic transglycosylase catalytic [Candidatus Azambacteria bacterium GW2011_GWA2_42_9]|nr:MAG: Lytic transglycosylase catalytic [Candidatus Azambacteria bacterium GW2011_GWB1_42_17]KKS45966.1 MAG: Lytic transglycosylase catalytic [Candidatus Azambacteria bacterium GW2011_GWA1_42_19]KKS75887.1 MAG: Lytic transglycosylase catalytic [Candidatus Azambacteria bacterium GW2011_GWA2_42_9]
MEIKTTMDEKSFSEKFLDCFLGCVAIGALTAFLFLLFGSKAYGAENIENLSQSQINELMLQKIYKLEKHVNALENNRIPAEIEFCGERVPKERGWVRGRLEKELLMLSRKQFILYIKRANYKYFPYIENRLKEWKMPDCLKYIPVIESALNPNALSSAKAGGFWQFIPGTARRYGLKQNINWDDRSDFEKATDAALKYLKENYDRFGSWALAMAAYNSGEDTIESAIRIQKTKDYYNLLLPTETMQYNYRAIVAYLVMSNPEAYGIYLNEGDLYKWPETEEVILELSKPKHVADIAAYLKISVVEFLWLNPQVKISSGKRPFKERFKNFIIRKDTHTFKIPKTP